MSIRSSSSSQRHKRIESIIYQSVATSLNARIIRNELLSKAMLTVTRVRVSPDCRLGVIFVVPLQQQIKKNLLKQALKESSGDIKKYICQVAVMKYVPRLVFQIDEAYDKVQKVNMLLTRLKFFK